MGNTESLPITDGAESGQASGAAHCTQDGRARHYRPSHTSRKQQGRSCKVKVQQPTTVIAADKTGAMVTCKPPPSPLLSLHDPSSLLYDTHDDEQLSVCIAIIPSTEQCTRNSKQTDKNKDTSTTHDAWLHVLRKPPSVPRLIATDIPSSPLSRQSSNPTVSFSYPIEHSIVHSVASLPYPPLRSRSRDHSSSKSTAHRTSNSSSPAAAAQLHKPVHLALLKHNPFLRGSLPGVVVQYSSEQEQISLGTFGVACKVTYNKRDSAMIVMDDRDAMHEVTILKGREHHFILHVVAYAVNTYVSLLIKPLPACSLRQLSAGLGGVPRDLIPFLICCIYTAISYLHKRHIAHRNVTDNNIVLMEDGNPMLTDFHVAAKFSGKLLLCPPPPPRMCSGRGTVRELLYASGPWTDVWGLGRILLSCINGHRREENLDREQLNCKKAAYSSKSAMHFLQGHLAAQCYDLTPGEKTFVDCCFHYDVYKRMSAVAQGFESEYFRGIDRRALKTRGSRLVHHDSLKKLITKYTAAGERDISNAQLMDAHTTGFIHRYTQYKNKHMQDLL